MLSREELFNFGNSPEKRIVIVWSYSSLLFCRGISYYQWDSAGRLVMECGDSLKKGLCKPNTVQTLLLVVSQKQVAESNRLFPVD
jgi:hypothetical protein